MTTLTPAALLRRASRLDALALAAEDAGQHELAASRRHRALIDRRAAAAQALPDARLCRCGVAVPRSALDRVLFRFLLVGGAWTCPDCRVAHQPEASPC